MKIFENSQPEEIIALLENFKKAISGTGTNTIDGRISYLRTMLWGEVLREFYKLDIKNNRTSNDHLKEIQEGLLQ